MSEQQDRKATLVAQRDKIRAKAAPLRAELDDLLRGHEARERQLRDRIRKAEAPLYDIEVELATYR